MTGAAIDYDSEQSPTLDKFHNSDDFLRAIMGPVGSGKECGVQHGDAAPSHGSKTAQGQQDPAD